MKMMHAKTNRNLQQLVLFFLCGLSLLALPVFAAAGDATLTMVDGGLLQEKNSGRMWQMERSKKISSAAAAEQYLRQLNQGPQKDWRLPAKEELYDLLTIFDLKQNGGITMELAGEYWLTDDNGAMYAGAWETGDQCGPERSVSVARPCSRRRQQRSIRCNKKRATLAARRKLPQTPIHDQTQRLDMDLQFFAAQEYLIGFTATPGSYSAKKEWIRSATII